MWRDKAYQTRLKALCEGLSELDAWVRMHYVYPYPHVDEVVPLMAENRILPYLDIPFQHASPRILRLMKRPGAVENPGARAELAPYRAGHHCAFDLHRRLPGRDRSRVRGTAVVP